MQYLFFKHALVAAVVYVVKEKFAKINIVNWKDVAVLCGMVVLVTFILLPTVGASTDEGKSILASNKIEDFKKFMELITVGLELIKAFL